MANTTQAHKALLKRFGIKEEPVIVRCPNKIRKRITMHEKDDTGLGKMASLLMPLVVAAKQRGSMWSRFIDKTKKFFN